jgi:hypothetical protein
VALSRTRVLAEGTTPYAHEREGIAFALAALPDRDPFHAWALVDLLDPSSGRLLELDLLILGYACLYLVELKAWPGRIEGDAIDWQWVTPDNRRVWRDNPRPLAHRKAQILKSRLERVLPAGIRAPWIEPLVFLTDANVKLGLTREGLIGVVRRDNFADAITHHEFPGADPRHRGHPINAPTQRAVLQGLRAIGFRERRGKLHAGSYVLGELLAETDGYQDRDATHRDIPAQKRRARTYLVPEQTSVELRQQLRRAAGREAQLLYEVREHPNVLTYTDYVADAEVGPTVLFDAFTDGIPLDAFLRREPDLAFTHRVAIIEGVSRALAHCHRRRVAHGGVSPSAILVRRGPEGKPETRLFNFQLGGADGVDPTSHRSNLGDEQVPLYQAPELRKGLAPPDPCTDLFSLGAIAYLVFTGQPPGTTLADVDARLAADHHLDPRAVSDALPREVIDLIAGATQTSVAARFDDATAWIELLLDAAAQAAAAPAPAPSRARSTRARATSSPASWSMACSGTARRRACSRSSATTAAGSRSRSRSAPTMTIGCGPRRARWRACATRASSSSRAHRTGSRCSSAAGRACSCRWPARPCSASSRPTARCRWTTPRATAPICSAPSSTSKSARSCTATSSRPTSASAP